MGGKNLSLYFRPAASILGVGAAGLGPARAPSAKRFVPTRFQGERVYQFRHTPTGWRTRESNPSASGCEARRRNRSSPAIYLERPDSLWDRPFCLSKIELKPRKARNDVFTRDLEKIVRKLWTTYLRTAQRPQVLRWAKAGLVESAVEKRSRYPLGSDSVNATQNALETYRFRLSAFPGSSGLASLAPVAGWRPAFAPRDCGQRALLWVNGRC